MPDIEGVPYESTGTALDQASAQALAVRGREWADAGIAAANAAAAAANESKALSRSVIAEVGSIRTSVAQAAASASASAASASQAQSTSDALVPRVEHIETMAGLAPGEVTDAQTANLIAQPSTATRDALSAAIVSQEPTVAAMLAKPYAPGSLVQTHGYFTPGDGGACRYVAIPTPASPRRYDLAGDVATFRPSVNGTIHPKMFGTINDGTALDNLPLQACYDYAEDQGIETIDGQGLTYNIGTDNAYDAPDRGWAHTGAVLPAGHTIQNATFRTASGSTSGTVPLTIRLDKLRPTYLRNIEIDGNKGGLGSVLAGREDGGCHLVHLWHPTIDTTPLAQRDFADAGDVYFENVTFRNAYSYGVRIDHLDCTVEYRDCHWDVTGIAAQMHATRNIITGGTVTVGTPRSGMVANPFQAEIEFNHAYTGTKTPSIEVRDLDYTAAGNYALVKLHNAPMQGLNWRRISIEDVRVHGAGALFAAANLEDATNPGATIMRIEELRISNSPSASQPAVDAIGASAQGKRVRIERFIAPRKPAADQFKLATTDVGLLSLESPHFATEGRLFVSGVVVDHLLMTSVTANALGPYGVFRDAVSLGGSRIRFLEVRGADITRPTGAIFVDAVVDKARVSGITARPPAGSTILGRLFFPRGTYTDFRWTDSVLEGQADAPGNQNQQLFSDTITSGLVYLNDVRHVSTSTVTVSVPGLAANRKVLTNVGPIVA